MQSLDDPAVVVEVLGDVFAGICFGGTGNEPVVVCIGAESQEVFGEAVEWCEAVVPPAVGAGSFFEEAGRVEQLSVLADRRAVVVDGSVVADEVLEPVAKEGGCPAG